MSNDLIPYPDLEKMGQVIAKSNLFGVKTPDQAIALMLVAQAQGIHPAQAAIDFYIIQGRPSLTTNAILARFQQSGGKVEYHTYTDQECKATFTHPQGGSLTLSWTIAQAKNAGLTGKDNWKMYARAMLRSRVIAEGVRAVYPAVLGGMYSQEEVQDFDVKPPKVGATEKVVEGEVLPPDAIPGPNLEVILRSMDDCETLECLKDTFGVAKLAFKGNREALTKIAEMKDRVKARLDTKMREEAEDL